MIKVSNTNKYFSFLIVMLPFLYQYRGIGTIISFGEVCLLPFLILYIIAYFYGSKARMDRYLLLFYFCSAVSIVAFVNIWFSISNYMTVFARLMFYGLLMFLGRSHFEFETIKKIYIYIAIGFALYAVVQLTYHIVTGGYLPIYLNYNWLFASEQRAKSLSDFYRYTYRASSLFLEPGYFTYFEIPALIYTVFDEKKFIPKIVISLGMLASNSTAGFIILGVVWTMYIILSFKKNPTHLKKGLLISLIAVVIVIFVIISKGWLNTLLGRLASGGSFGERVIRGWKVFTQLPVSLKFCGVGLNNMEVYVNTFNVQTGYDLYAAAGYCASFFSCLVNTGVLGAVSLLAYAFHLRKFATTPEKKVLYIVFVLILFYEAILFTYRFAFIVMILYAKDKQSERCESILSSTRRDFDESVIGRYRM